MGLEYVTWEQLAQHVPGSGDAPPEIVVMAQLICDPERAESLLPRHCA